MFSELQRLYFRPLTIIYIYIYYNPNMWFNATFQMEGVPQPDRDTVDAARWMAFEAANAFLARRRSERAPRRPTERPAPGGKLLRARAGFRCFKSMKQAIVEVTEAVRKADQEVGRKLMISPWGDRRVYVYPSWSSFGRGMFVPGFRVVRA